jgi:hypothetical protein
MFSFLKGVLAKLTLSIEETEVRRLEIINKSRII